MPLYIDIHKFGLVRVIAGALFLVAAGKGAQAAPKRLFLDVHEFGKGKVTAKAVADAHTKDLATQGRHGVVYKAYWVDEKEGKVYCLAEAPSAEAASTVHKEAHGLIANKIMEVTSDNMSWTPRPGGSCSWTPITWAPVRSRRRTSPGRTRRTWRSRPSTACGTSTTGSMPRLARSCASSKPGTPRMPSPGTGRRTA